MTPAIGERTQGKTSVATVLEMPPVESAVVKASAIEAPSAERMVALRAPLPEEDLAAWELQRHAFDLPEGAPPPHPGEHAERRVAVQEGRVVSCLTLLHAELCVRGARVPMGGIRHVATEPSEQNQGYAGLLLRDTLLRLRRQGVPLSVLFPFSFRYYRKFGYELAGSQCHFWCRPGSLAPFAERTGCRTATPEDAKELARFSDRRALEMACTLARGVDRWSTLCADPSLRVTLHGSVGVDGYAITTESRDSYGGKVLRVLDLAALTPRAWRALVGSLAESSAESVEWLAPSADLHASGVMRSPASLREGFKPRSIVTVRPQFQCRVVDLPGALRARAATLPHGEYSLAVRLRDELLPENETPMAVRCAGGNVEVEPARPTDPALEMDVRIFSQLYTGFMSASEAVSQGLARCERLEALEIADLLFPAGDPFIAEVDRF